MAEAEPAAVVAPTAEALQQWEAACHEEIVRRGIECRIHSSERDTLSVALIIPPKEEAVETLMTEGIERQVEVRCPRRALTYFVTVLFLATLTVICIRDFVAADRPFKYPHAFVSADVATTARSFTRLGILQLHGVPVNNNPPIGDQDFYTHWPPLLPMLLSIGFDWFGVSERTVHLFMLGVLILTAMTMFCIGRRWLGDAGGALASFFWLSLPVTVQFSHLACQPSLMVLFVVAAVLAFLSGRHMLGAGCLFVGALASWEVVLVAVGLVLASRWKPELRRLAMASLVGTGAGIVCVVSLYLLSNHGLTVDALHAAWFYMGISKSYSGMLLLPQSSISLQEQIRRMLLNNVWMLGPLGLGAAFQLLTAGTKGNSLIVAALCTPWLVWSLVMRNHMARHPFEFVIAAPFVALGLAWLANNETRRPMLTVGILAGLSALQILFLPKPPTDDGYDPSALIRYGQNLREFTESNSIVMAPLVSAVPLYYSDRHIVRGVVSPQLAAEELPIFHREFPSSSIYFAMPPSLRSAFPIGQVVVSNADIVILRLYDGRGKG